MRKKMLLLGVVVMVVGLCGLPVFALDPMGPATAGLKMTESSLSLEYLMGETELDADSGRFRFQSLLETRLGRLPATDIKDFETKKAYANFGFGITDNWEVFLRLGGADVKYKQDESGKADVLKFDGDLGFAAGFGTKITFSESEDGKLKWGALAQFDWTASDIDEQADSGTVTTTLDPTDPCSYSGTLKGDSVEYYEIQVAIGPSYKLTEDITVYGGPFLHYFVVDDDFNYDITGTIEGSIGTLEKSYRIDEKLILGGYIGAQVNFGENSSFNIEYQNAGDADAISANLRWRF